MYSDMNLTSRVNKLEKLFQCVYCKIKDDPGGGEPLFLASPAYNITNQNIINWDNKLSVETDPFFTASVASTITQTDIDNWNAPNTFPNLQQVTDLGYLTNNPIISTNEITAATLSIPSTNDPAVKGSIHADDLIDNHNYQLPEADGTFILDTQMSSYLAFKADLVAGKVPATQLPSYVDDVIEGASLAALNALPSAEKMAGKIYVTLDTNKTYRWSGSAFVEISPSSYVPTLYPKIRILEYTQDATNYILKIANTHANPSVSLTSPYYDIVVHSASLFAVNVTVTMDGVTQSTGTTNPYNASGQIHNVLIPKATNTSPIWNNDAVVLMAVFKGVDNTDGGIASPYNPRRIAYDADLIGNMKSKQPLLVSGTNIKTVAGQSLIGSGNVALTKTDVGLGNVDNTSDLSKPISTATQGALNAKQDTLVSGTNIKTINGNTLLGSGDIVILGAKNEAGQVKINYTGLSITGFTSGIGNAKQFNIGGATPTVVASPTTKYPFSTPNSYAGVFDAARNGGTTTFAGRLIENPIPSQSHRWRIIGNYTGRTTLLAETQTLYVRLRNPVSGFIVLGGVITLAPQQSTGDFSITVETIADTASISSPNGYILDAYTTYTDSNLVINLSSITRFSDAIEP